MMRMDFLTIKHLSSVQFKMSLFRKSLYFYLLFAALSCQNVFAALSHDQALSWRTISSQNFDIHFHNKESDLAESVINLAESTLLSLQNKLEWQPSDVIEIIISDEKDLPSGFSTPLLSSLRFTLHPTQPNELTDYDNWLSVLIHHELSHLAHLNTSTGNPQKLQKYFGRHPLLFPNFFQPTWLKEGFAIYMETDHKRGVGRGQSSIFEMIMRMEVARGLKTLHQVNISNPSSWPGDQTAYVYGYYFYKFIATEFGENKIFEYINNYSNKLIPFRVNENMKTVFGKTLDEMWTLYSEYLHAQFETILTDIKANDIVTGEQITSNGYYKMLAKPIDDNNLLIAQYDGKSRPELLLQNRSTGSIIHIAELQTDAHLDAHPHSGVVLSQIETYRNTNAFKDLYHVDIHSKKNTRLTRGDRYLRTTWHPDGEQMVAIYNKLGRHTLVLLNSEGKLVDLLWEGKEGEHIGGINWSPDGNTIIASVKRNAANWELEELNINTRHWVKLTNTRDNETQPHYSTDGKEVYFSADYLGVFNIRKLNLESGNITTITNVLGGAFSPKPGENNELFYIAYTETGYDIFLLHEAKELPVDTISRSLIVDSSLTSVKNDVAFDTHEYSALRHIEPDWWTPNFFAGSDEVLIGAFTTGSDALNIHSYDISIDYDIESTAFSGELNYSLDRWFPLIQLHASSEKRKYYRTETYQFELLAPIIAKLNEWYIGLTYAHEKHRETFKTNAGPSITQNRFNPTLGLGIVHDSRKQNIIANSQSDGRLLTLVAETSEIFGSDYDGAMFTGKWQEYIRIKPEHVLAIRAVGGFGLDHPRSFQLGGIISDDYRKSGLITHVPFKTTLYNKRRYAFRGYANDAESLRGRRMALYDLEWRFPLKHIDQTTEYFPAGLNQLAGSLFVSAGTTWESGIWPNDYKYSVGTELRFLSEWFYFYKAQIRLGYAYGFNTDGEHQLYLSLGSSF